MARLAPVFFFLIVLCLPMTGSAAEIRQPAPNEGAPESYTIFLPQVSKIFPWHNNLFGFESEQSITNPKMTQKVIELNPGWARLNRRIAWRDLQPEEGGPIQWDLLKEFEKELGILKTQQIQPIIIVDDYPRWATIEPNSCSPLREDKFDDFALFMQALVDRYSTPQFNVYNWELGNEVDIDARLVGHDSHYGCWGDIDDPEFYGGDYYGEMIKVVGAAIKARNPDAKVWLGGLMIATPNTTNPALGKPEHFLPGILSVGAAPFFDYVSYHGHQSWYGIRIDPVLEYMGGAWEPYEGIKSKFIRKILQDYGVDKPLFLSEAGVGCPDWNPLCVAPPAEFFQFQADQGIRSIVRITAGENHGYIWYQLPGPGWRYSALLNGSFQPQPIYTAYQQLIAQTWTRESTGQVDYGTDLQAFEYRKGSNRTHILWTKRDEIIPIQIPANEFIWAKDRDGQPITPRRSGSYVVVDASFSPIYLYLGPKLSRNSTIWPQGSEIQGGEGAGSHEVALFRREFTLSEEVRDLQLAIFADTRYELWVDGNWLGRGPARFSTKSWEYDTYAIDRLTPGKHTISVLGQWAPNYRRSESTAPGLMAELVGQFVSGVRFAMGTDASWKAVVSDAWRTDSPQVHDWGLIGPTEVLDLSRLPAGWTTNGFDSSSWPRAASRAGPAEDVTLQPRTIPMLQTTVITPTLIGLGTPDRHSTVIDIPPHQQDRYVLTFSASTAGMLAIHWVNESHILGRQGTLDGKAIPWTPAGDHPDRFSATMPIAQGQHTLTFDGIQNDGLALHIVWPGDVSVFASPITQHAEMGRRSLALDLPPFFASLPVTALATSPITLPITFSPAPGAVNSPAYLVLDLERVRVGRAEMEISGPAGTLVDIGWDEGLNTRPLPYPGSLYESWNQTDSWRLDGTRRTLRTIDARTGRYLYVTIWNVGANAGGDVTIHNLQVLEERYPVQTVGTFQSSDPLLDQIWHIGVETAKINMTDAYADPWRERGQWWGDAFIVDLTNQVSFGDTALLRRGLISMAEAFQRGSMVGLAPHGSTGNMRDYAMLWVHSLEKYVQLTGDIRFLKTQFPTLVALMDRLRSDANPVSGLLDPPLAHWNQTAYLDTWAGYGYSRDGQSAGVNAIYFATLGRAATLARSLGNTEQANTWTSQASGVRTQLNATLLDETGHYAATILDGNILTPTVFSQAWPLAYNMTPGDLVPTAIANLGPMVSPDPTQPTIGVYGLFWVAEAYANNGYPDKALDLIRLYYGSMIDRGATTWWERPDADQFYWAARSHGWGSWPTWFLSTVILGVEWTGPNTWRFQPSFTGVENAQGAIPIADKQLDAWWRMDSCASGTAQLVSPPGTRGEILFNKARTEAIQLNGELMWRSGASLSSRAAEVGQQIRVEVSTAGTQTIDVTIRCRERAIFLPLVTVRFSPN